MKKWYVITGILVLLLAISLGTCSSNSAKVDRVEEELVDARAELRESEAELADTRAKLNQSEADLAELENDLRTAEDDLVDISGELEDVRSELTLLKATKEIDFGNGLRIFDISPGSSGVGGKIQNVSSAPMEEVCILVAFYEEDGSFLDIGLTYEESLFPQEVAEWWVWCSDYWLSGLFDVYAIGNRGD